MAITVYVERIKEFTYQKGGNIAMHRTQAARDTFSAITR